MTHWIEGTSSAAIYGEKQKQFNVHSCSRCSNWFHTFCLKFLKIKPPKRTSDFVCAGCEIPETPQWHNDLFTNTCSVDNFLAILLLHCKQNIDFLSSAIGNSEIENVIKAGVQLMLNGEVREGKAAIPIPNRILAVLMVNSIFMAVNMTGCCIS